MNATTATPKVATSRSAKAAPQIRPAEAPGDLKATLQMVRDAIYQAEHKLELAYDATEQGSSLELMIDLIAHGIMADAVRPIQQDNIPTQADSEAVYEAMFAPLAALEGAIALAHGNVVQGTLAEAFKLLDQANDQLGTCGPLWKLLPAQSREERNFNRGRDLAIEMLKEGQALHSVDSSDAYRWYRKGRAQNRFVKRYLAELDLEPGMTEGFCAALSAALATDPVYDPVALGASMAEYEGGELGADGTETWPDNEASEIEQPAAKKADVPLWIQVDFIDGSLHKVDLLLEIIQEQCQFQYTDPEASERAQGRIIVLTNAVEDAIADARERVTVAVDRARELA